MSPPIRDGSGSSIGSIRLGDGSEIAEVRTGAGDVLFSAISSPDNPLFQYLYNDTNDTTTVTDESSNNNDGQVANGTSNISYSSDSVEGSHSLELSGDSINTGTDFYENTFTWMTWAYADTANLSGESDIFNCGSDRANLSWEKNNTNGFEFSVFDSGGTTVVLDLDSEPERGDEWVFLVGKHDASKTKIKFGIGLPNQSIVYESTTYPASNLSSSNENCFIGSDGTGQDNYHGRVDASFVKTDSISDDKVAAYKSNTNENK